MQHFGLSEPETAGMIGLPEMAGLIRHGWLTLMLAVLAGLAGATLWLSFATTPEWQAEARVLLASDLPPGATDIALANGTEIERLRAAGLAREVVETLGLQRDPGFVSGPQTPLSRLISGEQASSQPETTDRAARRLAERVFVQPVKDSSVARISVSATTAELARAIAQTHAEVYVATRNHALAAVEQEARAWLNDSAAAVEAARRDLESFHAGLPRNARGAGLSDQTRALRAEKTEPSGTPRLSSPDSVETALRRRQQKLRRTMLTQEISEQAPLLAEQDRLTEALTQATLQRDLAQDAWLRRKEGLRRAALVSDAVLPLEPAAPSTALIHAAFAAAGLFAGVAALLLADHRRQAPRRTAAALGLRLLQQRSVNETPSRAADSGRALLAALPHLPADIAILPAAPRLQEAAAAIAAGLAAAMSERGMPVRLILASGETGSTPGARYLAPTCFAPTRPTVTVAGARMVETMLSTPPEALRPQTTTAQVTLTSDALGWRGLALAKRSSAALLIVEGASSALELRDLRASLSDAALRPVGVVTLSSRSWPRLPT